MGPRRRPVGKPYLFRTGRWGDLKPWIGVRSPVQAWDRNDRNTAVLMTSKTRVPPPVCSPAPSLLTRPRFSGLLQEQSLRIVSHRVCYGKSFYLFSAGEVCKIRELKRHRFCPWDFIDPVFPGKPHGSRSMINPDKHCSYTFR